MVEPLASIERPVGPLSAPNGVIAGNLPPTAERVAWPLTKARCWFRIWYAGRLSKYSHSFAIEYRVPPDGYAIAACGLDPLEKCPDPALMAFDREDGDHCPACEKVVV